ncbi:MAG: InlB B-repeat-containing protein, partial [Paludibacteraceae bacterium]|nr:InlB B-repeat-containing protein [Paludibacteraceae bacterium]
MTLKCYSELDGTYTFSYIAPVADKNRFTVMIGGGADKTASLADGSTSGVTVDDVKYKFNVSSSPKQVDIVFNPSTDKAQVVLSDYTPNTEGWYFKCESAIGGIAADTKTALNSSGILTLSSVSAGTYFFYICNNDAELYWGQNKFGGCYVDQTNSTASLISSKTADAKFDGKQWPIKEVSNRKVKMVVSPGDAGKDVRISFDGGKIVLTLQDPPTPAATYTVTIHPNGGTAVSPLSVGEGQTISSISSTYGNGTAKWYKDEELTQEFILGTSTVTEDMDLYAKWGVSGNFYLVGDFGMHDKGSNWAFNSGLAMTTTDGVASVTYIAPKGRHRFEILTSRSSWPAIANQGSGLIAASTPTLSWSNEGAGGYDHFKFDLDAPKKVTVRYDGKVSVTAEDYVVAKTGWTVASKSLFGHGTEESPDNADDGAYMNGYNMTEGQMNSDGELVIHNLNAGTYKFWIGKYNTALNKQKQNIEVFGAAHVDKANSSLGDYGSLANVSDDTYNRSIPMDDKLHRRVQFSLNQRASIKIAFDGGKITVNLLPKYTVTFNSNDGSAVASQSVFEGTTATEPSAPTKAGYEFVKWQLSGADYDFSSAVTGNITLDAVWAYKAVSSVALNESEHTTWVGNSDFVLTLTKNPSDLITKSVVWSSDNTSAASVSDGSVHAEGVGTATITCTVTDMFDHVESASCEVSVAACEMTTDNLYSMTVTGYNSSTGSSATLNGLWNESSDNTEPATFRIVKLRFQPNSNYISNQNPYAADVNGVLTGIAATNDGSDQWYEIPAGSGNYNTTLYYLKNVKTNRYIVRGSTFHNTGNGEWYYYNVYTEAENPENGNSKWFYDTSTGNTRLICYQGYAGTVAATANDQSGNGAFMIHNGNWNAPGVAPNCAPPALMCGFVTSGNFSNAYTTVRGVEVVDASYANPNYTLSLMNSSYYRMKADATVRANLANGLAYGSVITVRLYADAATSVKLQTAAGDDVETINLSADAAREYTYTVAYGSELVGETAFVIKAADNHAGIASIEVSRMHAASPSSPALTWDLDLSSGVTQSALAGTFQHVASSALSSGAIHYVSSNPAVATVAADGSVTPIMAGNTTITATIELRECYAEQSINYNVTLTEPTLAELIAADAGAGITLTHDYAENIVIDK